MKPEQEALNIIDQEIATLTESAVRSETLSFSGVNLGELLKPPSDAERFHDAVARFVRALPWVARDYADDDVSGWVHAVKPHLTSIVGWEATTELGRAAGSEGYQRLHNAWNAAWDRAQPSADDDGDADVAPAP